MENEIIKEIQNNLLLKYILKKILTKDHYLINNKDQDQRDVKKINNHIKLKNHKIIIYHLQIIIHQDKNTVINHLN